MGHIRLMSSDEGRKKTKQKHRSRSGTGTQPALCTKAIASAKAAPCRNPFGERFEERSGFPLTCAPGMARSHRTSPSPLWHI
jgi:hypothetical protein